MTMKTKTEYQFRKSSYEKEDSLSYDKFGLHIQNENLSFSIPFEMIESIHVYYHPNHSQLNNHVCLIQYEGGNTYKFQSYNYISFANFEEQNQDFFDFVKKMSKQGLATNGRIKIYKGKSIKTCVLNAIFAMIAILLTSLILLYLPINIDSIFIIRILLISFLSYKSYQWFKKNYPYEIQPNEI